MNAIVEHLVIAQDPRRTPAILRIHDEFPQCQRPVISVMFIYGSGDVGRAFEAGAGHVREKSSLAILDMFITMSHVLGMFGPACAGECHEMLFVVTT